MKTMNKPMNTGDKVKPKLPGKGQQSSAFAGLAAGGDDVTAAAPMPREEALPDIHATVERFGFDEKLMRRRTVAHAAKHLHCDESTVRRMISRGILPHERLGPRGICLDIEDILTFTARGMPSPEANTPAVAIGKPRSVSWAAETLGVCRRTVLRAIHAGRIHAVAYSKRRIMVDEDEIVAYAAERANADVGPTADSARPGRAEEEAVGDTGRQDTGQCNRNAETENDV
jgi:excisionase family DNA binding protein